MSTPPILEQCAGIIAVTRSEHDDTDLVIIVQQSNSGRWGFPKGHVEGEGGEVLHSAKRELKEETGLELDSNLPNDGLLLGGKSFSYEREIFGLKRSKRITYFIGRIKSQDRSKVVIPKEEINDFRWVPLDSVHEALTWPGEQTLMKQVREQLKAEPL